MKGVIFVSIASNAGAAAAAREIENLINKKIKEYKNSPDVVKALEEIKAKTDEIKNSAEAGWY